MDLKPSLHTTDTGFQAISQGRGMIISHPSYKGHRLFMVSTPDRVVPEIAKYLPLGRFLYIQDATRPNERKRDSRRRRDLRPFIELGYEPKPYEVKGKSAIQIIEDAKDVEFVVIGHGSVNELHLSFQGGYQALQTIAFEKPVVGISAGCKILCPSIDPIHTLDKDVHHSNVGDTKSSGLISFYVFVHWMIAEMPPVYSDMQKNIVNRGDTVLTLPDDTWAFLGSLQ